MTLKRRYRSPVTGKFRAVLPVLAIMLLFAFVSSYVFGIVPKNVMSFLSIFLLATFHFLNKEFVEIRINNLASTGELVKSIEEVLDQLGYSVNAGLEREKTYEFKNKLQSRLNQIFVGYNFDVKLKVIDVGLKKEILIFGPHKKLEPLEDKLDFNPTFKIAIQQASAQ